MEINTVLVADDSDSDRLLLVSVLLDGYYSIIEAYNGEDAVQKTLVHMPDLIFTDVSMPKLNGYQVLRKLSKDISTQHIPIIIVGSAGKHAQERWATRQGARAYIQKPVDRQKVFGTITRVSDEERWSKSSDNTINELLGMELTDQLIATAERQLTEYVGPLASVLVSDAVERARDKKEFYILLARQIQDEEDRQAFLDLWRDEPV